ncbi:hypothetical protein EHP00_794 [Ecytonucleospora hepatopenaei]|uniref:Uncharacterized protein n=1 Tax=Ecytonucleospora hepatopenaei TaxID=646526 RepID=A0A1W0E7Z4_9MICR|nr:hypothetical protein EHP00_794 [Ecytonucleospora hepatopenaei]
MEQKKFIICTRKENLNKLNGAKIKNNKLYLIHNHKKYSYKIEEPITSYVKINEKTDDVEIINREIYLTFYK